MFDKNFSQNELNNDLQSISDWVYQWKISFNQDPNKQAQGVYFSIINNKGDFQKLSYNRSNIEACSSQKHVGLIMNDKMNFHVRIQNKISRCNKIIRIVKRLSAILPRDVLLTLYKMFIRLHLDYADIWQPFHKK